MSYMVSSKTQTSESSDVVKINHHNPEDHQDQEESETLNPIITSHLCLKPTHATQTLDKDGVLRRIRHRRRVNKVRNALQTILTLPFSTTRTTTTTSSSPDDKAASTHQHKLRWLDDAFSAP
ncbi:hypothetical protein BVC80_8893g21 [Macleaya cordata]|uniref:Uncharacterized protein n=1 Tax=Macleaya cordata TaxID=56857 RepID=A0A200Q405_MACCD|nr:hypothetical protein BVC80_8893g21 [Macleaya cordata]